MWLDDDDESDNDGRSSIDDHPSTIDDHQQPRTAIHYIPRRAAGGGRAGPLRLGKAGPGLVLALVFRWSFTELDAMAIHQRTRGTTKPGAEQPREIEPATGAAQLRVRTWDEVADELAKRTDTPRQCGLTIKREHDTAMLKIMSSFLDQDGSEVLRSMGYNLDVLADKLAKLS